MRIFVLAFDRAIPTPFGRIFSGKLTTSWLNGRVDHVEFRGEGKVFRIHATAGSKAIRSTPWTRRKKRVSLGGDWLDEWLFVRLIG